MAAILGVPFTPLCNIQALINNGIVRLGERADEPDEAFTAQ